MIILLYTYIGGLYDRRHSSEILIALIARMIIMIIIRKRPPLATGLALLTSQLRGLLEKRATYALRRWVFMIMILGMMVMITTVDSDDDGQYSDDDNGAVP